MLQNIFVRYKRRSRNYLNSGSGEICGLMYNFFLNNVFFFICKAVSDFSFPQIWFLQKPSSEIRKLGSSFPKAQAYSLPREESVCLPEDFRFQQLFTTGLTRPLWSCFQKSGNLEGKQHVYLGSKAGHFLIHSFPIATATNDHRVGICPHRFIPSQFWESEVQDQDQGVRRAMFLLEASR